ncbi:hypothetical protein FRC17_002945 [Serendipita sp. 399]|nr:hypothetical protein FRC17_002945 [Serendipita sp. 399]
MADAPEILRFGAELKDQVDLIHGVTESQLGLLQEIRDVIRERANLERDYSTKLLALTKKAQEKKAKRMLGVVLGQEPSKTYTDDTIRSSTLDVALQAFLTSWEETANLHSTFASELGNSVVEDLRRLERKKEETNRAERFSGHDRHSERVAKQYEQQKTDMLNSKNNYVVSIALANKIKSKIYQQDIPELEDQFQDIQANLIRRFVESLVQTQTFTRTHLNSLTVKAEQASSAIAKIDITRDQNLFVSFNLRHFTAPPDWKFEVCASYYDNATINTEPAPKIFLQNRLTRAQAKLAEAKGLMQTKEQEANGLRVQLSKEIADEKSDKYLEMRHQVTQYSTSVALLEKEIEVLSAALGGSAMLVRSSRTISRAQLSLYQRLANIVMWVDRVSLVSKTSIDCLQSSIWGLAKQGKTCKSCGISVHARCEMKVPAECTGAEGKSSHSKNSLSITKIEPSGAHTDSLTGADPSKGWIASPKTSSVATAATPSSFTTQPHHEEHPTIMATVVFDFTSSSPFEITVEEGDRAKVLEEDDGSGWVKIQRESTGKTGLVPASYLKLDSDEDSDDEEVIPPPMPVPVPITIQRSGKYVVAIYPYDAQGDDELALAEGEKYELTGGEHGGERYGEGWWEGISADGRHGIFPSNYVQHI